VYVVRLSCELPYAVGVQEEYSRIYYTPSENAKQKGDHIRAFFKRLFPEFAGPQSCGIYWRRERM
jgi:hypothetical protein